MHLTARAHRTPDSPNSWAVDITGEGIETRTRVRYLHEVEAATRATIDPTGQMSAEALMITVQVPEAADLQTQWQEARDAAEAARAQIAASAVTARRLATQARETFSVLDAAYLFDVGKARIAQLTKKNPPPTQ